MPAASLRAAYAVAYGVPADTPALSVICCASAGQGLNPSAARRAFRASASTPWPAPPFMGWVSGQPCSAFAIQSIAALRGHTLEPAMSLFDLAYQHAQHCAEHELCTSPALAAGALNCTPDAAREALKIAADAGYFRALLVPGCGHKIYYQPTPKAAGIRGRDVPKFLRAGLSPAGVVRGLLRHTASLARPEWVPLTVTEQVEICRNAGVPERGHTRVLLASEPELLHIFVPVLPAEAAAGAIVGAACRWLPLAERQPLRLHFVTPQGGQAAVDLPTTLDVMKPADLHASLAEMDARIAGDRSGMLALQLASERAALAAEVAGNPAPSRLFTMLGGVIEAPL